MIILQNIPRYPKKITTRELLEKDGTNQLRTTLRSFGRGVDIISPEKIRFQLL
jgi:hypothetical protein